LLAHDRRVTAAADVFLPCSDLDVEAVRRLTVQHVGAPPEVDAVEQSWLWWGYTRQVAGVAYGSYLTEHRVPDVSAACCELRVVDALTVELRRTEDRWYVLPGDRGPEGAQVVTLPDQDALRDQLWRTVLHEHLVGVLDLVDQVVAIPPRAMWGNVASDLGRLTIRLAAEEQDTSARNRLWDESFVALVGAPAPLGRLGCFQSVLPSVTGPFEPRPAFRRGSCCLLFKHSAGEYCSTCSVHDDAAVAAAVRAEPAI
jgi:hypothetical protein